MSEEIKLYHCTTAAIAARIIVEGFLDGDNDGTGWGAWDTAGLPRVGVWLTDDCDAFEVHHARASWTAARLAWLYVVLPGDAVAEYEVGDADNGYREWLIPAESLNMLSRVGIVNPVTASDEVRWASTRWR